MCSSTNFYPLSGSVAVQSGRKPMASDPQRRNTDQNQAGLGLMALSDLQSMAREEGEGMETTETESPSPALTPLPSLEQLLTSPDPKQGVFQTGGAPCNSYSVYKSKQWVQYFTCLTSCIIISDLNMAIKDKSWSLILLPSLCSWLSQTVIYNFFVSLVWSLEPFVWTVEPTKEELSQKLSTATRSMEHMNSLLHETEATNAVLMEQITVCICTQVQTFRKRKDINQFNFRAFLTVATLSCYLNNCISNNSVVYSKWF